MEGTGSVGLSFFMVESRPTSESAVMRPAPWTARWPAFPPQGALSAQRPCQMLHVFLTAVHSPSFRRGAPISQGDN